MKDVNTKYGYIHDISYIGRYRSGEIEDLKLEGENLINLNGREIIPLYGGGDARRKELPSLKFFKSGNIKVLDMNKQYDFQTSVGKISAEKVVFYEEGSICRLFPLDGKLSGYWTEEDEYKLSEIYEVNLGENKINSKIVSFHFYSSGKIKSVTLWPKERVKVNSKYGEIHCRIGISIYENGKLESCEPSRETHINTPIGIIDAYDKNALGIHGESNSLKFTIDGDIKSLITTTNIIKVTTKDNKVIEYSPKEVLLFEGCDEKEIVTVSVEFEKDIIILNGDKYIISENIFDILTYGGKKLYLGNTEISNINYLKL